MGMGLLIRRVLIACVALSILVACSRQTQTRSAPSIKSQAPARILLIGNSFTYFNEGIDRQLKGLAPSSEISTIAFGGYTLERHWNDGNTLQAIRQNQWTHIVLQEQSQLPIFDQPKFRQFVGEFDRAIKASGAKTILFMTWERLDSISYGVTTANLATAYQMIGTEIGAKVAPVGLAFAQSLQERPDLSLYSEDGHPTMYGTYLAACVLYGTIFEQSPVGNPYSDQSIPSELRSYFQGIAAKSLGY